MGEKTQHKVLWPLLVGTRQSLLATYHLPLEARWALWPTTPLVSCTHTNPYILIDGLRCPGSLATRLLFGSKCSGVATCSVAGQDVPERGPPHLKCTRGAHCHAICCSYEWPPYTLFPLFTDKGTVELLVSCVSSAAQAEEPSANGHDRDTLWVVPQIGASTHAHGGKRSDQALAKFKIIYTCSSIYLPFLLANNFLWLQNGNVNCRRVPCSTRHQARLETPTWFATAEQAWLGTVAAAAAVATSDHNKAS